jgi:ATP/maltotriose-dependent transcriptional regulator MalT
VLWGREAECLQLDGLLNAAREGRSGALVIRGEPGMGKSALLRYALERASGMTTIVARGMESESELPFAGLADLVRPLRHALAGMPPLQVAVLSGAVALGPPIEGDRFAVCAATLGLLASAAESSPLLVVVDDIQWLDSGSAEAVLFAARRISAEGVLVLLAIREGEPTSLELSDLPVLHVTGLTEKASLELLADQATARVLHRVAADLHAATQGNPLALIEISTMLTGAQRAGLEALPDPMPSGPRLEHAFVRRVGALPIDTQRALLVAAASESTDIGPIRQAVEQLGLSARAFEAAESSGLVTLDGADIRFRHPLIRSAIYQSAAPGNRREAHSALAQALDGEQVADRRTWHLAAAAAGPDESVASALERTAIRSMARSGYSASAKAFGRAAHLTPERADRARRLVSAANAFYLAGQHAEALHHLDEAAALVPDERSLSEIERLRAVIEMWARTPMLAHELLLAEAERVLANDPESAANLLAEAVAPCVMAGQVHEALSTAKRAHALAQKASRETPPLLISVVLVMALIISGESVRAQQLLDESLARFKAGGPETAHSAMFLMTSIFNVERYDEARQMAAGAAASARRAGAVGLLPYTLAVLSEIEFRTGHWPEAYASASESVRLADETGQRSASAYSLVCLARVEAAQGRDANCIEHVRSAIELAREHGTESILAYAGAALGLLDLGRGRPEQAVVHLEGVALFTQPRGLGEPNVIHWQPDLIESLARTGRTVEALAALELLDRQAEHTGRVWATAAAARCRGYLTEDAGYESHFTRALALHQLKPTPFEIARTQLCFGEVLRRHRRRIEARHHLNDAMHVFERLGAEPWANRARIELLATGERSRKRDVAVSRKLTPQELQIALAVAGGATNREAAAQLFLSPKTIEAHLSNVYAKLAVRSRTELARVFASEQPTTVAAIP